MKAPWKQTPLEQAQKRSPALDKARQIAELKHEIKVLQTQLRDSRYERESAVESAKMYRSRADDYQLNHERYKTLRDLELMVMAKDGAKYLKGEELDKYIDEYHGVSLQADINRRLSQQFQQALAASMIQTKQAAAQSILNAKYIHKSYPMGFTITEGWDDGNDTGSQGQETNQGNP